MPHALRPRPFRSYLSAPFYLARPSMRLPNVALFLLGALACTPASDDASVRDLHRSGAALQALPFAPSGTLRIEGTIFAASEPLLGAFVFAENAAGARLGHTQTDPDGRYELQVAEWPHRMIVKAHFYVPRFVTAPAFDILGPSHLRWTRDVGFPIGADGTAENLTFMVKLSGTDMHVVPHVAWGTGGAVGTPGEPLADLLVGPRIPNLVTLIPPGTHVVPNVEATFVRSNAGGDHYEVHLSEELNQHSLGAQGTAILIEQIVATVVHNADEILPVRIRVECASCPGGYTDFLDGHVGPDPATGGYSVNVAAPKTAFPDIAAHRFANHIAMAKVLGIASGYPDGTFRPNAPITRAEFAAFLLRALEIPSVAPTASPFSDVPTSAWYAGAVATAHAKRLLFGFPDETFRPHQRITRAELAAYLVNAAGWPITSMESGSFADVPNTYWAFAKIETAHGFCHSVDAAHYFPVTEFKPARLATRGEAIAGLIRMKTCLVGNEKK